MVMLHGSGQYLKHVLEVARVNSDCAERALHTMDAVSIIVKQRNPVNNQYTMRIG